MFNPATQLHTRATRKTKRTKHKQKHRNRLQHNHQWFCSNTIRIWSSFYLNYQCIHQNPIPKRFQTGVKQTGTNKQGTIRILLLTKILAPHQQLITLPLLGTFVQEQELCIHFTNYPTEPSTRAPFWRMISCIECTSEGNLLRRQLRLIMIKMMMELRWFIFAFPIRWQMHKNKNSD